MGFLSNFFKKDKTKDDKHDKCKNGCEFESCCDAHSFSRQRGSRRSYHFGDQSLCNPTACYQSVDRMYPKGARSCPREELSDQDSPVCESPVRLRSSMRQSSHREDRFSHGAFPMRRDSSRRRHFIDTSSGEEEMLEYHKNSCDRRVSELEEIKRKYREMKAVYRQERNESDNDKRNNNEVVDWIRRENKELEKQNEALRAELEKLKFDRFKRAENNRQSQRINHFNTSIDRQGLLAPRTSTPSPTIVPSLGNFPHLPPSLFRPSSSSSRAETVMNYRMSSATPPIAASLTGVNNATFTVHNSSLRLLPTNPSLSGPRTPQVNQKLHRSPDSNRCLHDYELVNGSALDKNEERRNVEDS